MDKKRMTRKKKTKKKAVNQKNGRRSKVTHMEREAERKRPLNLLLQLLSMKTTSSRHQSS